MNTNASTDSKEHPCPEPSRVDPVARETRSRFSAYLGGVPARKLILLGSAFLGTIVVLLCLTNRFISGTIALTQSELLGTEIQKPLMVLLEGIPQHLRLTTSSADAAGSKPASESLRLLNEKIDAAWQSLELLAQQWAQPLKLSDADLEQLSRDGLKIATLKNEWSSIREAGSQKDRRDVTARHLHLIHQLMGLMNHCAESSKLLLDPDLNTYYLMEISVHALPELQARTATLGASIEAVLKPMGAQDRADREALLNAHALILNEQSPKLFYLLTNVLREDANRRGMNSPIQRTIPARSQDYRTSLEALTSTITRALSADSGSGFTESCLNAWDQANSSSYRLLEATHRELVALLKERIQRHQLSQLVGLLTAILAIVLAIGFVSSATKSVTLPLKQQANDLMQMNERLQSTIEQRQRMEAAQRRAEENYRSIFENAIGGIFQTSPAGAYLAANPQLALMYGYESVEELKSKVTDVSRHLYLEPQRREEFCKAIAATGKLREFQSQVRRKDGSIIWISENARTVYSDDGTLLCYEGTVEDITARRQTESALRESEERTRVIVESAQDAFVLMDSAGKVMDWNKRAVTIFGWSREEMLGSILADRLIPKKYREGHRKGLEKFLQTGEGPVLNTTIEITALRKSGAEFPIELSISPIRMGSQIIFSAFVKDITARKQAEDQLRRSRDENELLVASLPAIVIVVDTRGKVGRWNPAAERAFGIAAKDVLGKYFYDTPIQWQWPALRQAVIDCFAHGKTIELNNFMFSRANGKEGCLQLILSPATQNEAEGLNYIVLGVDTTQGRLMETQLRQAQKMESIGQLAAGIAHEINTPTQFIGDNLRFLSESFGEISSALQHFERLVGIAESQGAPTNEVREIREAVDLSDLDYLRDEVPKAIAQSLEGTDRVAKIVRAMKEFSHPSADERKPIDLNKAIESTLTVARNEWKYVAEVEMHFDEQLPPIPCFPGDFNQVILNLVVNAAHAIAGTPAVQSGGRGRITISTSHDDGCAEIRITDTGGGIPENIQNKIFDPFFTTKEVGKGTGQGLFIAHNVVAEKHGGTISFESFVGQGTTFIIRLPLRPSLTSSSKAA